MGDEYKVCHQRDSDPKAVDVLRAPRVNSHWLGDRIRQNRVNLGMAVATDDGLIVPVIFDADRKRIGAISHMRRASLANARASESQPGKSTRSTLPHLQPRHVRIDQFTELQSPTARHAILADRCCMMSRCDGGTGQSRASGCVSR